VGENTCPSSSSSGALDGAAAARRLAVRERGLVVRDGDRVGAGLEELLCARDERGWYPRSAMTPLHNPFFLHDVAQLL
jgi:hypothetical protein